MSRRNLKMMGWSIAAGVLALAVVAGSAHAAKAKDPVKEAQRRMQIEMAKVQDEKAALGAELEALKKKSGELEAASGRAEHRRAELDRAAAGLRQEKLALTEKLTKLEQALEEEKKSLGEEKKSLNETRINLSQETSKRQGLEKMLSTRDKELDRCETKNLALYRYQVELINRAQSRGSLDAFLEAEPITGLGRIGVENLLEEYRDKVEAEKIVPVPGKGINAP